MISLTVVAGYACWNLLIIGWTHKDYYLTSQKISGEFIHSCECGIHNSQFVHTLDNIKKLKNEVEEQ